MDALINLLSALCTGSESAVRCGSFLFCGRYGVGQVRVEAPTIFNTCMDHTLAKMIDRSECCVSFGNVQISDLDFADDAAILADTLEMLIGALETLSTELEPLGLRISWVKTKIQIFNDNLDDAIKSVSVGGNNVDCVHRFTYLGSDISDSARCGPEVNRRIGRACGVMDSLDKGVWRCRYLCRGTKIRVFRSLVLPVLLYGCETWMLTKYLKNRLNVFGTKSLRRILGYRWSDIVSNDRVLRDAGIRCITCIITQRQLQLYGHVARFPENDPAAQILSARNRKQWKGLPGGQRFT